MSQYNFSSRELIDEGDYKAMISGIKTRNTKSGNSQKQVIFDVEDDHGKKSKISDFIVEIEEVYWKIQSLLWACGLPYEGKIDMSDDWDELLGKKLKITVAKEEYQGKVRNKIVSYRPIKSK